MDRRELRASDADREQAVDLLRGHAAVGRLTVEELDERCAAALAAKTYGDLDVLTADLPASAPPTAAVAKRGRRPRAPGRQHFADTWRAPARPEAAMRDLLQYVAPPLARGGYVLRERTPHRLLFVRSHRPVWTYALAVLLFPFGLLALLYQDEEQIAIDLQPTRDGTLVAASGVAPLTVRKAFAELEA